MKNIIGVRFKKLGKIYFFNPKNLKVHKGNKVIVETAQGEEFGEVVIPNRFVDDEKIIAPLKKVIRIANYKDKKHNEECKMKEKGGSLLDFLPLVKVALNFLGDFRRRLRVNRLELKLILAGGDPCDLAVNYGRAWAAVGNLMPQLERLFVIKKRDVEVECDFTASETLVIARLDLTITLGRLLGLAIVYGIRALREFLKLQKKRKGGATHEPDSQYA